MYCSCWPHGLQGSGASALAGPSGGTLKFCGTRSAGGGAGGAGGDVDVDVAGGNAAPRYEGDMYLYKTRGKVDGGGNAEWPEGSVLERCQLALPTRAFTEQEVGGACVWCFAGGNDVVGRYLQGEGCVCSLARATRSR